MANCVLHPGSKSVASFFGKNYCAQCKQGIEAARKKVDRHVQPKDCFIWYANNKDGWQPIGGTGCAHWVAHERGIRKGSQDVQCQAGFPFRVLDVISSKAEVELEEVRVNDLYVAPDKKHVGLVIKVNKPKKDGDPPQIMIEHDSSAQGGVKINEFATYFKGKGTFRR